MYFKTYGQGCTFLNVFECAFQNVFAQTNEFNLPFLSLVSWFFNQSLIHALWAWKEFLTLYNGQPLMTRAIYTSYDKNLLTWQNSNLHLNDVMIKTCRKFNECICISKPLYCIQSKHYMLKVPPLHINSNQVVGVSFVIPSSSKVILLMYKYIGGQGTLNYIVLNVTSHL